MVALKLIRTVRLDDAKNAEATQRFRIEAQAAARLEHDHIVPVYEVGEIEGGPFYSMRFVEGRSLKDIVDDGPLNPRQAATWLAPVAHAVDMAHQKGVLHRDLKPANLLLDSLTERVLIADFGLAKLAGSEVELTVSGQVFGSPPYMPPEQAAGRPVDPTSDVYSLGATLYHMITGRPPFRGKTIPETLRQVVEEEPVPPRRINPRIDRDLENICLKCLEKDPKSRYRSAMALALDLRCYLERRPVMARPTGPVKRCVRWCRRHLLLSVLLVLAATTGLATMIVLSTRPAWLQLNVFPADASVLLDGQPVALPDDGSLILQSDPGRHELTFSAPGYRERTEVVELIRGRSNLEVLPVDLVPLLGRLQIESFPPGARVVVCNSTGEVVTEGSTPYVSVPLPTGSYTVRLEAELHRPAEREASAPDGNQTLDLGTVVLQPVADSERDVQLTYIGQQLSQIESIDVEYDAVPLIEFADDLATRFDADIIVDEAALSSIGMTIESPVSGRIAADDGFDAAQRFLRSYNLGITPILGGQRLRLCGRSTRSRV